VSFLIVIVVLFAVMWLFLIRPQRRRQLEQARLQGSLEPGDEILTAGGIHGTVRELEDDVVLVEIAPQTVIRLDRRAVAAVAQEPEPEAENETPPEGAVSGDES
jgi:preprotein translocase subunit YajC